MAIQQWLAMISFVAALVVFALDAGNVQPSVKPRLIALGLAFLTLGMILTGWAGPVPR